MGCDIHAYSETKIDDKWEANEEFSRNREGEHFDVDYDDRFDTDRNYDFYGIIAGVKRPDVKRFEPKGFPKDSSSNIKGVYDYWDADAHTPSYLTLDELEKFVEQTIEEKHPLNGMMKKDQLERLQESLKSNDPKWIENLYPYCAWTTIKTEVQFDIMVPFKDFILPKFNEWIEKLKSVDKEGEKRVIFWFDN